MHLSHMKTRLLRTYRSTSSILAWILTTPLVITYDSNIRRPWKMIRSSSTTTNSMGGYACALSTMRRFATSIPPRAPRCIRTTTTTTSASAMISLFASDDDVGTTTSTVTHYFTCRHNYEQSLMQELMITQEQPINAGTVWKERTEVSTSNISSRGDNYQHLIRVSSPYPGLIKAEYNMSSTKIPITKGDNESSRGNFLFDPVYALQILPNSMEVSGTSIRELAKKAMSALVESTSTQQTLLPTSPRGSLTIHALVPDMFKGNPKPKMQRRVSRIANEMKELLEAMYPCARKFSAPTNTIQDSTAPQHIYDDVNHYHSIECILQLLLLTPECLVISLSPVQYGRLYHSMSWPCAPFTAGLANAEEDTLHHSLVLSDRCWRGGSKTATTITNTMVLNNNNPAPSSAYRKLIEALSCMGITTIPYGSTAIDLGASPGGWTSVLRKLGFKVIAVDRAPLHQNIRKDEDVTYISGDAFAYLPPTTTPVLLMVSDIVAYPERVVDLLNKWCSLKLATTMIVTMKFKGNTPAWDELRKSKEVADQNGYSFRAKHFFNNKNEVTLMLATSNFHKAEFNLNPVSIFQPTSMYDVTLPSR
jgi:hypothetical protein